MSLLDKLLNANKNENVNVLAESPFFAEKDIIKTDLPILNIAFSGKVDGGFTTGISIFAGESKSFKTMLGLYCMKAYMKKYPDAVVLFYDSEFGSPPAYLSSLGIDTSRVIHIPIEHVEMLKFDIVKRLSKIENGERVFIFIDSLGNLASKKEVEDAESEKSVADMSRAKGIRSLLRIITPHITMKDIPCVIVNHVYQTQEMFSKTIIGGGTAVTYTASQIFVISKSQEKSSSGDLTGWNYNITINKSRYVREKSRLTFYVDYESGIQKYSGLFELAMEGGFIKEVSKGWYSADGEKKLRRAEIEASKEFWQNLFTKTAFPTYVEKQFALGINQLQEEEEE